MTKKPETKVAKLPTAAVSYYTVVRAKGVWRAELVTPVGKKALRTTVGVFPSAEEAAAHLRPIAEKVQRPLKLPKGVE